MRHFFPRDFRKLYPVVSRAKGLYVWDSEGRKYIDAVGGAAVVGIGHGVAEVTRAVAAQMRRVSFVHSSQFVSRAAVDLSREIVRFAGKGFRKGRVYFCSSGSEAVETSVKLARAYHLERGEPERRVVLSRTHSYHGATLGCLNYGGQLPRRRPYEPMLDQIESFTGKIPAAYCYRCPWGLRPADCDVPCAVELEKKILEVGAKKVSAFIAEPAAGASFAAGVPSDLYWPQIRRICDRYGVLLIADEVITGFGRLGSNFGLGRWKVNADIVAMGKGISSGYLPLAAVLAREPIWTTIAEGSGRFEHGFTSHDHPVACAAGVAVIREIWRRDLVNNAARMGVHMQTGLEGLRESIAIIGDVRGAGLLWGLEFVQDRASRRPFPGEAAIAERVRAAAFRRRLIVYPGSGFIDGTSGDHVMLAPPLSVTRSQIEQILDLLARSITDVVRTL